MVFAKTELFKTDSQNCATLYKALSHPARIEILKYLAGINSCFSGDISNEIPLSRTTVKQHLTELKKAGLIKGVILGNRTKYCINAEKVNELKEISILFFKNISTTENFEF